MQDKDLDANFPGGGEGSRRLASAIFFAVAIFLALGAVRTFREGGTPAAPVRSWRVVGGPEVRYAVPKNWFCADPYSTRIAHDGRLWHRPAPPDDARAAYFRSPDEGTQMLLVLGSKELLWKMLDESYLTKYDDDPRLEAREVGTETTADGTEVPWCSVRLGGGLLGAEEERRFLAIADLGARVLLVNGGGAADRFDREAILAFLRSLRLAR